MLRSVVKPTVGCRKVISAQFRSITSTVMTQNAFRPHPSRKTTPFPPPRTSGDHRPSAEKVISAGADTEENERPFRIFLVRSGESMGAVNPQLYSHIPDMGISLSPQGQEQAISAGKLIQSKIGMEESVELWFSPYVRTRQTSARICKQLSNPVNLREEPRLRAQDFGNIPNAADFERQEQERKEYGAFYYRYRHGESSADVYDRVSLLMERMNRWFLKSDCVDNFVLVTHGITLQLFLMRYYGWEVSYFHQLSETTAGQVVELKLNKGMYELKASEDTPGIFPDPNAHAFEQFPATVERRVAHRARAS